MDNVSAALDNGNAMGYNTEKIGAAVLIRKQRGGEMIRVAVVEDDAATREALCGYVERYAREENVDYVPVPFSDAVSFLEDKAGCELVFMDIAMPQINGMRAAQKLRERDALTTLVFVTSLAQFAVKGYEVDACDFIVKPVFYEQFKSKMKRIRRAVESVGSDRITFAFSDSMRSVRVNDIRYAEVSGHVMFVHVQDEVIETRKSISRFDEELKKYGCFFRINACYLVNARYVTDVDGYDCCIGSEVLKISRSRKKAFMDGLTAYFGRG